MFDFTDPLNDLRGKEIKRLTLTELVEYVSNNRGVLTETVYPDLMKMVSYFDPVLYQFVQNTTSSTESGRGCI
jgi:hypothetical protein